MAKNMLPLFSLDLTELKSIEKHKINVVRRKNKKKKQLHRALHVMIVKYEYWTLFVERTVIRRKKCYIK